MKFKIIIFRNNFFNFLFTNFVQILRWFLSVNNVSCLWRHFYHSIVVFLNVKSSFLSCFKYISLNILSNILYATFFYSSQINSTIKLLLMLCWCQWSLKVFIESFCFPIINKITNAFKWLFFTLWNSYKLAKYFKRLPNNFWID